MGHWPNPFSTENDDLADEKFINSEITDDDIADIRYIIEHGDIPPGGSDYRVITKVGLQKILLALKALAD